MTATRANLMKTENALSFSKQGYSLLDKKRNVLIRELMGMMERAEAIGGKIDEKRSQAYEALRVANITLGSAAVSEMAMTIPVEPSYTLLTRSIMGVEIPRLDYQTEQVPATYGFFRTNAALDDAVRDFHDLRYLLYELAEVEETIYRLAEAIKSTQKRANALDRIRIPELQKRTKSMTETLEEREREDFFRLKRIKGR